MWCMWLVICDQEFIIYIITYIMNSWCDCIANSLDNCKCCFLIVVRVNDSLMFYLSHYCYWSVQLAAESHTPSAQFLGPAVPSHSVVVEITTPCNTTSLVTVHKTFTALIDCYLHKNICTYIASYILHTYVHIHTYMCMHNVAIYYVANGNFLFTWLI